MTGSEADTRALPPALLAISVGDLTRASAKDFLRRVVDAAQAGLRGLLLREKQLGDRDLLDVALAVRAKLRDLWLGLHDRPHLAAAAGAQAVHLGRHSLSPEEVRPWLPERLAIGLSTHRGDDLAAFRPVDYVFFGPVRRTRSKPSEPVGFDELRVAATSSRAPVWALGGLSPLDASQVRRAGAAGLACMSGILGQADPARAVEAYLREWA